MVEPTEYLRALRRRWWVPAVAILAALLATLVVTPTDAERARAARRFAAEHTIALTPSGRLTGDSSTTPVEFLAESARLFRGPEVARRVSASLGLRGDPETLASRVAITVNKKRGIITFAATGRDEAEVARVVNTFAEEAMSFQLELHEQAYEQEVERTAARVQALTAQLNDVESQMNAAKTDNSSLKATRDALAAQLTPSIARQAELAGRGPPTADFATVSDATPVLISEEPDNDGFSPPASRRGRLVLAIALALTLAVAVVLVLDRFDTRLRTKAAAESAFGLPVLAEVPRVPRRHRSEWAVVTATNPLSTVAEAYRGLRSAIMLAPAVPRLGPRVSVRASREGGVEKGPAKAAEPGHAYELRFEPLPATSEGIKVILVTSPGVAEGKSTTVANLAASFAEADRSVVVIDCDLRRPSLDRLLDVDTRLGLSDVLVNKGTSYRLTDVARPTSIPGVRLVSSGTPAPNPARLLTEAREVLLRCRGAADVVIVDTPAALVMNDAAELVPAADAVVVVVRAGKTTTDAAGLMAELLARLGAPVFGVALIGVEGGRKLRPFPGRGAHRHTGRRRATRHSAPAAVDRPLDTSSTASAAEEEPTAVLLSGGARTPNGSRQASPRRVRPFRRGR